MPGVQDEGRLSRVRWLPDPDTAVTLVSCVAANSLGQQVVELETNLRGSQSFTMTEKAPTRAKC